MITKRIIPCLDVRDGRVVKGRQFQNIQDVDDPVALAKRYCEEGADELVFYDITASAEKRDIFVDVVERTAAEVTIPFTVGGGISSIEDFNRVLRAGADKVSINSQAVERLDMIREAAKKFGSQCVVLSMDVKKEPDGVYRVYINGGRKRTDMEAVGWARWCVGMGAGEIVVNSINTDGQKNGFDLELLDQICKVVKVPVIASGGAGSAQDFVTLFQKTKVDAGLAASIFHFGEITIPSLKDTLYENGINVRRIRS